ncbi:MAG TPA: hypothetical protein DDX71_06440 [Ruminococcus sp.]|nr:hypothetical protein [Ruminococcus sp.]
MTTATEQKSRSVFVVVTSTGTSVARAIRVLTKMPYSHVSLSSDASLRELYSFSRSFCRVPLPATFNRELIGEGTLGRFDRIPCEIYEIPMTQAQYARYEALIQHFVSCRKMYSYSLMGLIWVKLQKERQLQNKFVCSQFVAYVLEECGIVIDKPPCLCTPEDLRHLPEARLIYRGELNSYYRDQIENMNIYMPLMHSAV